MAESAKPYPKSSQLARGQRRYPRKVASPKRWQQIIDAKIGPCRVCVNPSYNGADWSKVEFHHIVSREDGGDDTADNIVPLHRGCHDKITRRVLHVAHALLCSLTDAEYAYMVDRGGEDYAERAYGLRYER